MDDFNLISVDNKGELSVHDSDASPFDDVQISLGSNTSEPVTPEQSPEPEVVVSEDDLRTTPVSRLDYIKHRIHKYKLLLASNGCWGFLCLILIIALA